MDAIFSLRSIGIPICAKRPPAPSNGRATRRWSFSTTTGRPAGYIVSPALMARIMDQLADRVLSDKARDRMASLGKARKINITTPQFRLAYHVDDAARCLTILAVSSRDDVYALLHSRHR